MTCSHHYGQIFLVQRIFRLAIWCLGVPAESEEEIRSSDHPPPRLPASNISINVMNVTQGRHPAAGQQSQLMVISDVSILSPLSSHHKVLQEQGEVREGERVGDGQPSPDIIQILSIKTNNQMQSYSPPALSLSYQSSLPEKTSSVFTYISTSRGISSYLLPQLCITSTELEYFCWFVSTNL